MLISFYWQQSIFAVIKFIACLFSNCAKGQKIYDMSVIYTLTRVWREAVSNCIKRPKNDSNIHLREFKLSGIAVNFFSLLSQDMDLSGFRKLPVLPEAIRLYYFATDRKILAFNNRFKNSDMNSKDLRIIFRKILVYQKLIIVNYSLILFIYDCLTLIIVYFFIASFYPWNYRISKMASLISFILI